MACLAKRRCLEQFIKSIEPADYLSKLPSPGKLIMFHFTDDPVIPVDTGQAIVRCGSTAEGMARV